MRSLPDGAQPHTRLQGIPGVPPDPAAMPPGCRFAPRCDFAIGACSSGGMPLRPMEDGHATACIRGDAVRAAA